VALPLGRASPRQHSAAAVIEQRLLHLDFKQSRAQTANLLYSYKYIAALLSEWQKYQSFTWLLFK
jgi:hypothetical protein